MKVVRSIARNSHKVRSTTSTLSCCSTRVVSYASAKESYEEVYKASIDFSGPAQDYWHKQAQEIHWFQQYDQVLQYSDDINDVNYGRTKWFVNGKTNTCYNAVDVHVKNGRGDHVAVIYDSAVTNQVAHITYNDLLKRTKDMAGVLRHTYGVKKGDVVVIYMPMIPEAIVAMLACQRIGAIHSVVFGGFPGHELAYRVKDARAKLIICTNYGIEPGPKYIDYKKYVDNAIGILEKEGGYHKVRCLVYQRPSRGNFIPTPLISDRDLDWDDEVKNATPVEECVPVDANDPAYLLYTSGTTGSPKGVIRPTGGHMVAVKYSMQKVFDYSQDDVMFSASDIGWVVGHSFIIYGPLCNGMTTVFYEGKPIGTPDAGAYWRLVDNHRINAMFSAPTAYRAIKKEDPSGLQVKKYNTSSLRALFVAGERCDPETLRWIRNLFDNKLPVIDNWWQTETGFPICSKLLGMTDTNPMDIVPGSCYKPLPGYDVRILPLHADAAEKVDNNQEGQVVIKLPLPPGNLSGLWGNEIRFRKAYLTDYPGFYNTGDAGHKDDNGNVFIMSRTDDIINVAAHRLSTSEMEQVLTMSRYVVEGAVVGMAHDLKGEVPVGFVVLSNNPVATQEVVQADCIQLIRSEIGALACFKNCIVVKRLPKTRSGKILRNVLRKMVNKQEYKLPATIEDPTAVDEIQQVVDSFTFNRV